MVTSPRPSRERAARLRGRSAELSLLAGLVAAVLAGESRVLVVRGEPGVGKTTLLDELAGHAAGCRVVRTAGMQPEMEFAFAGLHQLLAPMLDRLDRLPVPQRNALRTAFGLSAGPVPDRFLAALPELIEAAARSGNVAMAGDALQRLAEATHVAGTDWGLGIEARSRALVTGDQSADGWYAEAIDRLGRTQRRTDLARAHLLYGEWLRRQGRRIQAREQLRTAHAMLEEIGMEAFAERARRELAATGETARKRPARAAAAASQELTAQEAQIARLARDGLSNPEIGARLFISSHTVQYHLSKVFTKLGITSRGQLHRALPDDLAAPASR